MVELKVKEVTWDPKKGLCFYTPYYEAVWKSDKMKALENKSKAKWEKRKEWEPQILENVLRHMRYERTAELFDINKLETTETVLAIAQKIKDRWGWPTKGSPIQKVLRKTPKIKK